MDKEANFGFKAIRRLYNIKLLIRGAKVPGILTFIILIFFILFDEVDKSDLEVLVDLVLAYIPSLLGFVLSGYAILIGFGNIKFIAKKPESQDGETIYKPTIYQKLSTVFSMGLIMQIAMLLGSIVLKLVLRTEIPCINNCFLVCRIINYSIFTLLVFGLLYITAMIKDLVVNIFNVSQYQHLQINKKP